MIYLSGCVRDDLPLGVGVMLSPNMGNRLPPDRVFALDNGAFSKTVPFSPMAFIRLLERHRDDQDRCLFAVAPDVVADAAATLDLSRHWMPLIRDMGYRVALVAQDGLESLVVPWESFDALFMGGTTGWKLSESAYHLMAEAKRQGKHVHAGRVNSLRRLRTMAMAGSDSADGTFIAFAPDHNTRRMQRWIDAMHRQPALWGVS